MKNCPWPPLAVVENLDAAGVGQAGFEPVGVVMTEKLLVGERTLAVGRRLAPAVEQVAPVGAGTAAVARGLGSGRAVVNDPYLVQAVGAEQNLVERGVVVN